MAFWLFMCNLTMDYENPIPVFNGKEIQFASVEEETRKRVGNVRSTVSALQLRCVSYTCVVLVLAFNQDNSEC